MIFQTVIKNELKCLSVFPQALYQLYFDLDMGRKNAAQKWLTQAQSSAHAWHFCWALLSPDKVRSGLHF